MFGHNHFYQTRLFKRFDAGLLANIYCISNKQIVLQIKTTPKCCEIFNNATQCVPGPMVHRLFI